MIYYLMLRSHHPIPQHQRHKLYLRLMELLVQYPRPLLNLLPNKSRSQMLFLIVHPRIHLALVKPQRSMLSSLLQRRNPQKERRKAKVRVNSMPQNSVLQNCLLVNLCNGNISILTSFARKITTLRIVRDDPKLVTCSKGPSLSSKSRFCLSRPKW